MKTKLNVSIIEGRAGEPFRLVANEVFTPVTALAFVNDCVAHWFNRVSWPADVHPATITKLDEPVYLKCGEATLLVAIKP